MDYRDIVSSQVPGGMPHALVYSTVEVTRTNAMFRRSRLVTNPRVPARRPGDANFHTSGTSTLQVDNFQVLYELEHRLRRIGSVLRG